MPSRSSMNTCDGSFIRYFLRPISPYGFAIKTRHRTGYEMGRFLEFYKKGLAHILKVNSGGYRIAEVYTQILLTKILTPHGTRYVDMQSPAGEAWNVLVYNYDGDVYASDESRMLAEMNDRTFRLGNVHKDTRRTLVHRRSGASDVSSILQSGARGLLRLRIPVILRRRPGVPLRNPGRHVREPAHERILHPQHGYHQAALLHHRRR
jgi:hypothetical protein